MQEDHLTDVQTYSNNFTGTTCTHMLLEIYKQTHGNQFSLQNKWMNNYLLDILFSYWWQSTHCIFVFMVFFLNLIIIFQIDVQIHPRLLNLKLNILLVYNKE